MSEDESSLEERLFGLMKEYQQPVSRFNYWFAGGVVGLALLVAGFFGYRFRTSSSPIQPPPTLEMIAVEETATPSPTIEISPTPLPEQTYTPIKISTPTIVPTPTSTPTPLPPTPTRIPPTSTPTPMVTPTWVGYKYPAPQIFRPEMWEHFRDPHDEIAFSWGNGPLGEEEYYDVRMQIFRATSPKGGYRYGQECRAALTKDFELIKPRNLDKWSIGDCYIEFPHAYSWSVRLVKVENGVVVRELSPRSERVFNWSP